MVRVALVPLLLLLAALPCVDVRAQSAAPASPPATVVGTWRGTSICRPIGKPACHDEVAVYHFRRADSAASTPETSHHPARAGGAPPPAERLVWQASKVVNGVEEEMGTMACTYDRASRTVLCPMRDWRWIFRADAGAGGDTLTGTLVNPAGVVWRDVRVVRGTSVP